jgi:hypothetical protein
LGPYASCANIAEIDATFAKAIHRLRDRVIIIIIAATSPSRASLSSWDRTARPRPAMQEATILTLRGSRAPLGKTRRAAREPGRFREECGTVLDAMERGRRALAAALLLLIAAACSAPSESATPSRPTKQPPTATATASPTASSPRPVPTGDAAEIRIQNLTYGHTEITPSVTTAPIDPPAGALLLAHVMAFWPGGPSPPELSSAGATWTLVGGNLDGEKRHWVYRGSGATAGPVTIDFGIPTEILWVIDAVEGADTGNEGSDAIVQFASQESQRNAADGSIQLQPFEDPVNNAAVCFALAGSGAASDIVPTDGFVETAEAENPGANLIISDFWKVGEDTSCDAEFQQDSGAKEIQSWLFLALELRPERT